MADKKKFNVYLTFHIAQEPHEVEGDEYVVWPNNTLEITSGGKSVASFAPGSWAFITKTPTEAAQ